MQLIHAVNEPINIILMGQELLSELLERFSGVIDHGITGEAVKFHDGIRKFGPTRNDPCSENLETVVFDHQSKLRTIPGKPLDYLPLIQTRLQIRWSEFILDTRIEFHGQIRQVPKNIMEHIWFRRELNLVAGSQIVCDQENAL